MIVGRWATTWRKSSRSGEAQSSCVEVATAWLAEGRSLASRPRLFVPRVLARR
ncbi:DUF397 domain-containing protein [Actinoallomurus vinaceus]|uniref:DUF397 domain-containing protein n=1 Tax=Actinoallomurus vinaceus TaxID=1080074 RepID=UPI003CD0B931